MNISCGEMTMTDSATIAKRKQTKTKKSNSNKTDNDISVNK